MELATQPLQPAPLTQPVILGASIEQQMQAGYALSQQLLLQIRQQQLSGCTAVGQQARPLYRGKGNRRQILGVITPPCPLPGICPLEVEYVLAIGVLLQVQRHDRLYPLTLPHHPVRRLPAGLRTDRATVFQCLQKSMTQKGIAVSLQGIPLRCGNSRDTIQPVKIQRHSNPHSPDQAESIAPQT